jgi:oligopeptidase B
VSEKLSETCKSIHAPIAKKASHLMTHHEHKREDNYYWMRDDERQDQHILAHLKAENDYCDQVLKNQQPLEKQLFEELKGRIVKDDSTVPVQDGQFWYHSTVSGDDEFARHYRTTHFEGDNQCLLLDVNQLASEFELYELGDISISQNDELLAYSEDTDGRRIYTIRFKDIHSGAYLTDLLENTEGQTVWANDNETVYYVKKDLQTLLGFEVYRHKLGTQQADDVLVYQENDRRFYMGLGKSRDDSLIFIYLQSTESTDTWLLDANTPDGEFTPAIAREDKHEFDIDKLDDVFYITTNWQAKNFRLMTATQDTLHDKNQWQACIDHRETVLLESVELFNHFMIVTERELGQIRFVVYKQDGRQYPLEFNDPCYYAALVDNPEPNSDVARIYYSSLTTPGSLFEFDLNNGQRKLLKQQKVLGDFNADDYRSERLFITARDGAKVPVSLVYHKEKFKKDNTNPVFQYGYGAYGITIDPNFSTSALSLLDRGFIYVIAHIRGSEMLGRDWYENGKKQFKQNTFNDFIDVTKALIEQGYAAKDKVFASGGSAGGLLMGAVVNQAPELYKGIGCHVPFLDVLTTMLDDTIPLTTNEYEEWGNPNNKADYDTILAYSPIDNITAQAYPNILVTTGLHDSQVQYWEPMKWVAKLREYKTNDTVLVFKTDMDAGHGGASGRFKSLKEKALEMAFFISLLNK